MFTNIAKKVQLWLTNIVIFIANKLILTQLKKVKKLMKDDHK